MKKIVLLSVILIFLITGISFAFQNEPEGFRGLKWGDTPTEDMTFLSGSSTYSGNCYYREDDKFNIGTAKLDCIFYHFTLYSNQFCDVSAGFYSETTYNILKVIFEEKYGKPTLINEKEDRYFLIWNGENTKISLTFDFKKWDGLFLIESLKIHPEKPEDNKQKELEKAKDDF